MNQEILTIIGIVLGVPLAGFGLYLLVRVVSAGFYKSKREFTEWYFAHTTKKPTRRETDRREEEILP